jgi:hypothetical protein
MDTILRCAHAGTSAAGYKIIGGVNKRPEVTWHIKGSHNFLHILVNPQSAAIDALNSYRVLFKKALRDSRNLSKMIRARSYQPFVATRLLYQPHHQLTISSRCPPLLIMCLTCLLISSLARAQVQTQALK